MMRIVIVTNSIAPYTHRLYEAVGEQLGHRIEVLACTDLEPQRRWAMPQPVHYARRVLAGLRWHVSDHRHIYVNPGVVAALWRGRPDAVIVHGVFSPTMALAALTARARRIPYLVSTDGTLATDPGERSRPHAWMRRLIVPHARAGLCASAASAQLLVRWGLDPDRAVVVPIVNGWDAPSRITGFAERPYDLLFSGTINEHLKGALFFADVVARCVARGMRPTVRVVGDGPLRAELAARLQACGVSARFDGYLQQNELPEAYASARLLLFPSRLDPWGLVANEAVACGTPVIGSPHATSSLELLEPFGVGRVLPLDVDRWATAVCDLLASPAAWSQFQTRRAAAVAWFSVPAAVAAFDRAVKRATTGP